MKNRTRSQEQTDAKAKLDNPKFVLDKSLNKYSNVVLFPRKLAQVKAQIEKYGLPKENMDSPKEKESK